MKKNRLALIIVSLIIVCFDALSLILRKDFNVNFWFGFSFVQLAWVIYILMSLFVNESSEEQRGVKPIEFINISNIVIMMILAIVFYAVPKIERINLLVIPYVVLFTILAICLTLGFYNKKVIKEQSSAKPLVFDKDDLMSVLNNIKNGLTNEQMANQVDKMIQKIENIKINENDKSFQSLSENVIYLHESIKRKQESNLLFQIQNINKIINELKD